jgi:hypothetical protein
MDIYSVYDKTMNVCGAIAGMSSGKETEVLAGNPTRRHYVYKKSHKISSGIAIGRRRVKQKITVLLVARLRILCSNPVWRCGSLSYQESLPASPSQFKQ